MRKFSFLLLVLILGLSHAATAQNRAFPNAIHAKLNFFDYGTLNDADFKLGEGFELGYFRNVAPFLNVGIPFKLGLAKLPPLTGDPAITGNTVTTSIDVVFHLENIRDDAKISPYAFAGAGYFLEEFKNGHAQIPFGLGVNFRVSKYAFINAQAEFRKALKDKRDNLQLGVGFVYLLHKAEPKPQPPADTDKDGTPDAQDQCVSEAGPAATLGCPDSDNDGVADKDDTCPTEAGTVETHGCPDEDNDGFADKDDNCPTEAGALEGCPDTDRDGVSDQVDECPTEAGTVNGCPDSDADGVANKDDKCPREAGTVENNGCPAMKDADGDGVADEKDPCPDAAGPFNGCPDSDTDGLADNLDKCPNSAGPASNQGCPEVKKETKERLAFAMRAVQFETGKAVLKGQSFKVLDEILEIMNQYPDYKLAIGGHTDDVGSKETNLYLSTERAKACYDYLLYKGIPEGRVRSTGYGESKPMVSNNSPNGREQNRRVEFELTLD